MIEADLICFDLDGTLVDSAQDLAEATAQSLRALGIKPPSFEEIISHVGGGARGLLRGSMGGEATDERVEAGLKAFMVFYDEHLLDNTRPYPGAREVLKHFFNKKTLALVTNKPDGFTVKILEGLGLSGFFEEVLGYDSVEQKKPHPEGILRVLTSTGIEPSRAVMVGDSPYDVLAGRGAGVVTVGATYGFKPLGELTASGPDHLIDDIRELTTLIPI